MSGETIIVNHQHPDFFHIAVSAPLLFSPAMLNFSIVGRNANLEQRQHYNEWDSLHGQRIAIVDHVNSNYDDIEATRGGMISIDIAPLGANKSQILNRLRTIEGNKPVYFFGDGLSVGKNDYPLKVRLYQDNWLNNTGHKCFETDGPDTTMKILARWQK